MFDKRFWSVASLVFLSGAMAMAALPAAGAAQDVDGYEYALHSATVDADELGKFPPDYADALTRQVRQGPRHTLQWSASIADKTVDHATFVRGERRLGLLVPYWPAQRSASQKTGWSSFGNALVYDGFDFTVERGADDRRIAGHAAKSYLFKADFRVRRADEAASIRQKIVSRFWVVPELPFSFAPYAVLGMYADPRLSAAIEQQLGELGMVVRVDSHYSEQTILEDGSLAGSPNERSHVGWVTDLKAARVPAVDVPVADEATLDRLMDALGQADPKAQCQRVFAGQTPAALASVLSPAQQPAVRAALRSRCGQQALREFGARLNDDPQATCAALGDGRLASEAKDRLTDNQWSQLRQRAAKVRAGHEA